LKVKLVLIETKISTLQIKIMNEDIKKIKFPKKLSKNKQKKNKN